MIHSLRRLANNDYVLSILTKVLTVFVGIVSSAFSTRYLGVKYKDDYAYITQIANIAMIVLNLGIYQSYSYNYKRYGKEILKKYNDICFFQFLVLIVCAAVLLFVFQGDVLFYVVLLVPFNIIKNQYENFVLIENLKLRMKLHAINSILIACCYACLYFFVDSNVAYIVILTVFVDIVTILFYSVKLRLLPDLRRIDFVFLKSVLRFGFIPMLSGLLSVINYSVDVIFLRHIGIEEELSYYALAANIINFVWMIPDAFKDVLFSKSAKEFDSKNIIMSSQISVSFIYACIVGFTILGRLLIQIVYGTEFLQAYMVTIILLFGAVAMAVFKIVGVVLVSQGRRMAHFVALAISATINIGLNILLIPMIGMYGAALASVSSYMVCALVLLFYFSHVYKIHVYQMLIPSKDMIKTLLSIFQRKR